MITSGPCPSWYPLPRVSPQVNHHSSRLCLGPGVTGGIGAALLLPAMQSLIHGNFDGGMRKKVLRARWCRRTRRACSVIVTCPGLLLVSTMDSL